MFTRKSLRLAAAAAIWLAQSHASPAQNINPTPTPAPTATVAVDRQSSLSAADSQAAGTSKVANQELAERIAAAIRHSGIMRHFTIDISCNNGQVVLTGQVASAQQQHDALRLVGAVPGVQQVKDQLRIVPGPVAATQPVQPAQALNSAPEVAPQPRPNSGPGPMPGGFAPFQEPMPMMQMMPGPHPTQPPPMPPNAWPSLAPHNNYSRVAYPTIYPYKQWPHIGPMYPFPKVPLGWRSVTLSWYDGYWWYGKKACGHDWWRVRYW